MRGLSQGSETRNQRYSMGSNIIYFYRRVYKEFPQLACFHLLSVVSEILLPCFGILMPGIVVAMVEKENLPMGLAGIAAAGAVMMLCGTISQQINRKIYFHENLWRNMLLGDAALKGMRCRYEYVEYGNHREITRKAYYSLLRGDGSVSYKMLDLPRSMLISVICFFLYSSVLGSLKLWLVVVLLVLSLINYGILQMKNRWLLALRNEFAQSDREINYMNQSFRSMDKAKDIRIFAMNDWLTAFRRKVFRERLLLEKRNNRRIITADALQLLLSLLRNGMAYGYLISACLQGNISVAGFLVYFGAITGFSGFVTSIADTYSELKLRNEDACIFRTHMDMLEIDTSEGTSMLDREDMQMATGTPKLAGMSATTGTHKKNSMIKTADGAMPEKEGEIPEALFKQPAEIRFCNVSFSYGDKKVYDHFNLTIRPGEKVALLGVNGAGKTTLVKLLCGLYEPDEGKILINGVDTAALPKRVLYDLFSVVFQETAILPYPMGCNVSFQKLEDTDEEKVWDALRQADLEQLFREKGVRTDTYMRKIMFADGVELSGGQAQKLLLARAIYKNGNILVLDEPTSALDPIAESEVYQKYVEISKGRTSLFISHRLASTRFSDRILFMENGRIQEEGTHEELMALGGSYAHMYEVQAHYYAEPEVGGEVEEHAE